MLKDSSASRKGRLSCSETVLFCTVQHLTTKLVAAKQRADGCEQRAEFFESAAHEVRRPSCDGSTPCTAMVLCVHNHVMSGCDGVME